jgi:hypothetical protein
VEGDGGRAAGQLGPVHLAGPLERGRHRQADLDRGAGLGVQHLGGVVDDLQRPGRLDPPGAQLGHERVHPIADRGRDLPEVAGGAGRGHRLGRQLTDGHLVRHDILPVQEPLEEREHAPVLVKACLEVFPVPLQALGRQVAAGVAQDRPDLLQRHLQRPQDADGLGLVGLGRPVVAVAGGRVDERRPQQAELVVVAQRLHRQPGRLGEAPDRQQVVHLASLPSADHSGRSPDRRVKRPVRRAGGAGSGARCGSRRWGR